MKLWDDNNDQEEVSDGKYVQPTQEEFELFLLGTRWDWDVTEEPDAGEIVYESRDFLPDHDDRVVRIFSTIDKRTGKARSKGSDAIRTVIWDNNISRPIGGRTKTLRIKTWKKNLLKKLKSLDDETETYIETCDECGSFMVIRNGQYGEFFGCVQYPDCSNTKNIED